MSDLTKDEMFQFLVEACMKEHKMSMKEAQEYVSDNISADDMHKIVDLTNQMIVIAKDNPKVVDGMMEKMKDLGGANDFGDGN